MTTPHHRDRIAVVGTFQVGKSTLVNALLGDFVAQMGGGLSTTRLATSYHYADLEHAILVRTDGKEDTLSIHDYLMKSYRGELNRDKYKEARVALYRPILQSVVLVDTPGLDANETDEETAKKAMGDADAYLLVVSNESTLKEPQKNLLKSLDSSGKPYLILMNCQEMSRWKVDDKQNEKIASEIRASLTNTNRNPWRMDDKDQNSIVYPCNVAMFAEGSGLQSRMVSFLSSNGIECPGRESFGGIIEQSFKGATPSSHDLLHKSCILNIRHRLEHWRQPIKSRLDTSLLQINSIIKTWEKGTGNA